MPSLLVTAASAACLLTALLVPASAAGNGNQAPSRAAVEDAVRQGFWCLPAFESAPCVGRLALGSPETATFLRGAVEAAELGKHQPGERPTLHVHVIHVWPDSVPGDWLVTILHALEAHGLREGLKKEVVRVRRQPGGGVLLVPTPSMVGGAAGRAGLEWELAEATARLEAARALGPPGHDELLDDHLLEWYRGTLAACERRVELGSGPDADCDMWRARVTEFQAMDATARGEAWLGVLRRRAAAARERLEASDDRRSR